MAIHPVIKQTLWVIGFSILLYPVIYLLNSSIIYLFSDNKDLVFGNFILISSFIVSFFYSIIIFGSKIKMEYYNVYYYIMMFNKEKNSINDFSCKSVMKSHPLYKHRREILELIKVYDSNNFWVYVSEGYYKNTVSFKHKYNQLIKYGNGAILKELTLLEMMICFERSRLEKIDTNIANMIEHTIKTNFLAFLECFPDNEKMKYCKKLQGLSVFEDS